jgi:hypothetical protein
MSTRPYICLKCQSHLARRTPPKIRVAFQSTSTKSSDYHRRAQGESSTVQPLRKPYIRPTFLQQTKVSPNSSKTPYSLGKLYGHAGRKKREDRERLNVDALGAPADVIVLRDTKVTTYTHVETVDPAEAPQPVDILATLDNERGLVGQKEVEENINHFRPKDGEQPQNRDDFNRLVQDVQSAFTVSQLARYIHNFSNGGKHDSSKAGTGSSIPRISPWMPETSKSIEQLDDESSRGYSLASYTAKQRLVLRLLRECWKLELPELEYGVGEVELELKPEDYELLLSKSM